MYDVIQQQICLKLCLIGFLGILINGVDCFVSIQLAERRISSVQHLTSTDHPHATNFDIFQLNEDKITKEKVLFKKKKTDYVFPYSKNQLMSIQSTSPAVLLKSGPGTGKTYTLASRVAYLIKTESCPPERMVILSFSNNDAFLLKTKALDLFEDIIPYSNYSSSLSRKQVSERLWSGTIHRFSINVIRACNKGRDHIRVLSSEEVPKRIDRCLHQLLDEDFHRSQGPNWNQNLRKARLTNRDALVEVGHSRSVLIHQIKLCVELWKECSIAPLPSFKSIDNRERSCLYPATEACETCMELASRLGINRKVADLAWNIFPILQDLHTKQKTADPADLATIAFNLLLACPQQLSKLRKKLRHVILDEYQDVSVAQHALIRLIIRGVVDESSLTNSESYSKTHLQVPPVLVTTEYTASSPYSLDFDVPSFFCAGDSQQSIYGFRGAAPKLSIDGFRKDFPQGVIAEIETNFRLPTTICSMVNSLVGKPPAKPGATFKRSPAGISRIHKTLGESLHRSPSNTETSSLADIISEKFTNDLTSSMHIQGLWDEREEAKYIASMIKRRSKERLKALSKAIKKTWLTSFNETTTPIEDPTMVAIIVRGANQMNLIREALDKAQIPYEGNRKKVLSSKLQSQNLHMRPVALITMHNAKGEEYDDIFLPGWTEGVFPHPSAVSSNRIDEERRLAFVALSRARHQVVVTHSYIRRVYHDGPNLHGKKVTTQVRASRFLHELVPNGVSKMNNHVDNNGIVGHTKNENQLPIITWDRSSGSKGSMAGSDLPAYFQKSYETPGAYVPSEHLKKEVLIIDRQLEMTEKNQQQRQDFQIKEKNQQQRHQFQITEKNQQQRQFQMSRKDEETYGKHRTIVPNKQKKLMQALIPTKLDGGESEQVFTHINNILQKKRGSAKEAKTLFLELLKTRFGFKRGRINLFSFEEEVKSMPSLNATAYGALVTSMGDATTRPRSRGTALQLGLFLAYSLQNIGNPTME
mmetsp:Transcript_43103/g.48922  ORF Transcript_43103/g.48922 Transcript_43103/m.48922 type:complete len:985 (-) Transcript_43103:438-3392(-)